MWKRRNVIVSCIVAIILLAAAVDSETWTLDTETLVCDDTDDVHKDHIQVHGTPASKEMIIIVDKLRLIIPKWENEYGSVPVGTKFRHLIYLGDTIENIILTSPEIDDGFTLLSSAPTLAKYFAKQLGFESVEWLLDEKTLSFLELKKEPDGASGGAESGELTLNTETRVCDDTDDVHKDRIKVEWTPASKEMTFDVDKLRLIIPKWKDEYERVDVGTKFRHLIYFGDTIVALEEILLTSPEIDYGFTLRSSTPTLAKNFAKQLGFESVEWLRDECALKFVELKKEPDGASGGAESGE